MAEPIYEPEPTGKSFWATITHAIAIPILLAVTWFTATLVTPTPDPASAIISAAVLIPLVAAAYWCGAMAERNRKR
jgi:hypothetical protein